MSAVLLFLALSGSPAPEPPWEAQLVAAPIVVEGVALAAPAARGAFYPLRVVEVLKGDLPVRHLRVRSRRFGEDDERVP